MQVIPVAIRVYSGLPSWVVDLPTRNFHWEIWATSYVWMGVYGNWKLCYLGHILRYCHYSNGYSHCFGGCPVALRHYRHQLPLAYMGNLVCLEQRRGKLGRLWYIAHILRYFHNSNGYFPWQCLNMGVGVGIMPLGGLQAELHLGGNSPPPAWPFTYVK